jgi:N-acetylneuraminic acid mutarotase
MRYSFMMVALVFATGLCAETKIPEMPVPVSSFGAAVEGDFLYTYGGHVGKAHSYSVETAQGTLRRLNLKQPDKWEDLADGPRVQGVALVAHKGKIYRIGGMQPMNKKEEKTNTVSQSSVSAYDLATKSWHDLPPLPAGRSSHDAVVSGETLYVFGGWNMKGSGNKSEWHKTGLSLDLSKADANWKEIPQPFVRRALTMAARDGKVYVICGMNDQGETSLGVNVYDTKSGMWTEGAKVPGEKMNGFTPAAAVANGQLYLTSADGKVYRLNSAKNEWEEIAKLAKGRIVARMVASGNQLLVLGGVSAGAANGEVEVVGVK